MKRNIFSLGMGVLIVVIAVGLFLGMPGAAKAAPYFQGKVIILVGPSAAGGGTDMWQRMLSMHLNKFIPGKPVIVVRDMPGAGGVIGANYAFAAKPNGLTLFATSGNTITQNITRPKGTDFKLEEMIPIYASPEGCVYFIKPGLIKEPKDILTAKGLIFGHNAPTAGTTSPFLFARELLGFDCKMVLGYQGSGPARLAFITGESNVSGGGTAGYNAWKPFLDKGEAVPLFQTGVLDAGGNIVREKSVPSMPTISEFYQQIYGKPPSGPNYEAYKLLVGTRTFSQILLLPPKTPAEVVNIYKKAVMDMVKDPKFLDDAERLTPNAVHLYGQEMERIFPSGVSGKPETVKFIKNFLTEKYSVVFD